MNPPNNERDAVYAQRQGRVDAFAFDASVAKVFDDMIRRSVPGYGMTLSLLSIIADHYAQPNSRIYDLGCSTGAGLVAAAGKLPAQGIELIGIDNAPAMLQRCETNTADLKDNCSIDLRCEDVCQTPIENASLVILNFTLQFIPVAERNALLARICEGLNPGGVLVLSEKIQFEDPQIQDDLTTLHHDFKRAQGYSDLEISQKRSALENVLIPETIPQHEARLDAAGFARHEIWLQCFNFVSFLAFK